MKTQSIRKSFEKATEEFQSKLEMLASKSDDEEGGGDPTLFAEIDAALSAVDELLDGS